MWYPSHDTDKIHDLLYCMLNDLFDFTIFCVPKSEFAILEGKMKIFL